MRLHISLALFFVMILSTCCVACLRATPDKRAIQWSDLIVHAKLKSIPTLDAEQHEVYDFDVADVIDGSLKSQQTITAIHIVPGGLPDSCSGHLTPEDIGKPYLLLLRHQTGNGNFVIVTIAPVDSGDPAAAEAFKQLVAETRKAEAAVTPALAKAQATAFADAEDDTEAEQAEDALRQMGSKAIPAIWEAASATSQMGKSRLNKLIDELTPPNEIAKPATQTTEP